jgi:hypothetical protein
MARKLPDNLRVSPEDHEALILRMSRFPLIHVAVVARLHISKVRRIVKSSLPMKRFEHNLLSLACDALDHEYRAAIRSGVEAIRPVIINDIDPDKKDSDNA